MTALKARAALYQAIRQFFNERHVLEVETPVLCPHTVTDAHIDSIAATVCGKTEYLQTSPEYWMKRLLIKGSGCIYQICKAFRDDERGKLHNPEFTMLEWYRIGFDHHDLMDELDQLLQYTLKLKAASRQSYQDCFLEHLNIDPFSIKTTDLQQLITDNRLYDKASELDHDTCLQLLLSELIEPKLGIEKPYFIYDFPPSQAALAKVRQDQPPVAERFELYINGVEIANGFHELSDANEQLQRFQKDQQKRKQLGKTIPEIDNDFISVLRKGLPDCAGVAVGLDRLLMISQKMSYLPTVCRDPG